MDLPGKGKYRSPGWSGYRWAWKLEGSNGGKWGRVLREITGKGNFMGSGRNLMQGKLPRV